MSVAVRTLLICLVVLAALVGVVFRTYHLAATSLSEYFVGNLLPELLSMTFEIGIISLALAAIQKRRRSEEQRTIHDRLSQILGFVFEALEGNLFHWSKQVAYAKPLASYSQELALVKTQLSAKTFRIRPLAKKCVVETCHQVATALASGTAAAFSLPDSQGLHWLAILQSVQQLAELYPFHPEPSADANAWDGGDAFALHFEELIDQLSAFNEARERL